MENVEMYRVKLSNFIRSNRLFLMIRMAVILALFLFVRILTDKVGLSLYSDWMFRIIGVVMLISIFSFVFGNRLLYILLYEEDRIPLVLKRFAAYYKCECAVSLVLFLVLAIGVAVYCAELPIVYVGVICLLMVLLCVQLYYYYREIKCISQLTK